MHSVGFQLHLDAFHRCRALLFQDDKEFTVGSPQTATSGDSTASEWRTAPLWGTSHVGPYLHDGRAPTLNEAILMHGGEGQASRDAYSALTELQRQDILEFLRHL